MKSATKHTRDEPGHSERAQEIGAMVSKGHEMLERIRDVRGECGDGARMLPVVRHERKLWFLDERLKQLRNIRNPNDFVNLNDFEIEYFKGKVV